MSRIGKKPVQIPKNCEVKLENDKILVKAKLGQLSFVIPANIEVKVEKDMVKVTRKGNFKQARINHGLTRAMINNMVIGVTTGYKKVMEFIWQGGKLKMEGKALRVDANYRTFTLQPPEEIKIELLRGNKIEISGCDKQKVGEIAAKLRAFLKPEPYKGKGIRYENEHIALKPKKTGI